MRYWNLRNVMLACVFCLVWLVAVIPAQATSFAVQFTVTGFTPIFSSYSVPTDPVTGTIVYQATDIHGDITSLTSINLTIDGHTYTLSEIGSQVLGGSNYIGGTVNGITGIGWPSDDFRFGWNESSLAPNAFTYMSTAHNGWASAGWDKYTQFSITPSSAVPEPATVLLLGTGLLGLVGLKRKLRK